MSQSETDQLRARVGELLAELSSVGSELGIDLDAEVEAVRTRLASVSGTGGHVAGAEVSARRLPVAPPVLGVDAGKGGWVGALLVQGRCQVLTAPTLADIVELALESHPVQVVAVDIPIGLPDTGRRQADVLVRKELPGKASSVFTTLTRSAYQAPTYSEARAANLAATSVTDQAMGAGAQSYALRERILDVDAYVRDQPAVPVVEVHPELCFARLAGAPILASKRTTEGQEERIAALGEVGFPLPWISAGPGYAVDDLLDACAAAWSAARHAVHRSVPLPNPPEVFSDGLQAAIWV